MQKLLLFSTAIIVAAAAYVGLSPKEETSVVEVKEVSNQTKKAEKEQSSDVVLLAAIHKINAQREAKAELEIKANEILTAAAAAVEVAKENATKKKVVVKKTPKKKAPNAIKVKSEANLASKEEVVADEVSTKASATTATNTTTATLANDPLGQMGGAGIAGFMSVTGSTDFKETTDSTKAYASQVAMSVRFPLQGKYNLMVGSSFAKDLSGGFDERLNNTNLTLGHAPVSFAKNTIVIPRLRGIYPTSKASKVRDEMNGAIALTPIFAHQLTSRIGLTYIPTGIAYSHKFKTNRVNQTNNQYTMSHTFVGTYNFTDLLSTSVVYSFGQSWSYFGTEKDRQYATDISMMYVFANRTNLSAGINTGGLLFDAEQGPDSNVEFYNPETTSFYLTYGIAL